MKENRQTRQKKGTIRECLGYKNATSTIGWSYNDDGYELFCGMVERWKFLTL